jgi:hypothetical protein
MILILMLVFAGSLSEQHRRFGAKRIGAPDVKELVSQPDLVRKIKDSVGVWRSTVYFDYQDKVLVATDRLSW